MPVLLPAPPVIPSPITEEDAEPLSPVPSDDDTPPVKRSTRTRHTPNRYGEVAHHIALSSISQSEMREPLSYHEAVHSPEAHFWKRAMDEETSSLYEITLGI